MSDGMFKRRRRRDGKLKESRYWYGYVWQMRGDQRVRPIC